MYEYEHSHSIEVQEKEYKVNDDLNKIVYSGDEKSLRFYLSSRGTVDSLDGVYLEMAAKNGHLGVFKALHEHGVSLNLENPSDLLVAELLAMIQSSLAVILVYRLGKVYPA